MIRKSGIIKFILAQLSREQASPGYYHNKRKWPIWNKVRSLFSKEYEDRFFFLTFSILGKLAYTDGVVGTWQHDVLEGFMGSELNLSAQQKTMAFSVLRKSRNLEYSFEELLKEYFSCYGNSRTMLEHLVGILLDVALADDRYTQAEHEHLSIVIRVFGISETDFSAIKKRQAAFRRFRQENFSQTSEGRGQRKESRRFQSTHKQEESAAYSMLEVKATDSIDQIKKNHRKLVMQYHPDRLRNSGLSSEFISRATLTFHEIQRAYEIICKERGI